LIETDYLCSEKTPLNQALRKDPHPEASKEEKEDKTATIADTKTEADALRIPPDPSIPTGILSVIIHQINNRALFPISVL
jgi:hypothetical protein